MNQLHFNKFPSCIVLHIFQYFTSRELLLLTRVCKHWKQLIADRCLWKYIKFSPYPITKLQLSRTIKQYFNEHTKSLDLCGKLKKKSSHAISDRILGLLAKTSPNLIALKIEDEWLHEVDLSLLPVSLHHLHFISCEINLACLCNCETKLENLRSLIFQHCPCINDKHLCLLGKLNHLERLASYVENELPETLKKRVKNITSVHKVLVHLKKIIILLDLNGSYRVCDATVQVITRNFPNLKHLTLIGCAFCGDAACSAISNGLDKLESLQIEEWTYVTQTGIELLIAKNLKFLSVQCRQINGGQLFIQGSQTLL